MNKREAKRYQKEGKEILVLLDDGGTTGSGSAPTMMTCFWGVVEGDLGNGLEDAYIAG